MVKFDITADLMNFQIRLCLSLLIEIILRKHTFYTLFHRDMNRNPKTK